MAEELKTLREAALAIGRVHERIDGIHGKLNYLTAGLGFAGAAMLGAFGFLFVQVSNINGAVQRLDERTRVLAESTDKMARTLTEVRDELVAIRTVLRPQAQAPEKPAEDNPKQ